MMGGGDRGDPYLGKTIVPKAGNSGVLGKLEAQAARTMRVLLPVTRAHLRLAFVIGRLRAGIAGVPDHVGKNIESALGETLGPDEIADIARRYVNYSKRTYLEVILPKLRDFDDSRLWPVEGLEHLNEALENQRGVILLTGHYGYARLIPHILQVHRYEVRMVVLYSPLGVILGEKAIAAGLDVRPIFRALADNQIVLSLGDGLSATNFVQLSLLDKPYPFPTGIMKIAMMTHAPVLPVFAEDGDRRTPIRVVIHPPLPIDPSASVATNVEHFARALDQQVRGKPHLYRRWILPGWFETVAKRSELRRTREIGLRG